MRIVVNGEPRAVSSRTLAELLGELGYGATRVATALDGAFVPAARRGVTSLEEGSTLEILAPMQGG